VNRPGWDSIGGAAAGVPDFGRHATRERTDK